MIWDAIDFVCRETVLQLRRERLISIATISTVGVLLVVLGAIVLFHINLRLATERMGRELKVWAYFSKEVARPDAQRRAQEIASWPEVRSAKFVPKEEGIKELESMFPSSSGLKGMKNPLPDGVQVRVTEPSLVPEVAKRLSGLAGVTDVVPREEEARDEGSLLWYVVQGKRIVSWVGAVIVVLVTLAGVFIVHNTIRLALHARWREIYIMQLVGASRALIAAPFLLAGAIHGTLGAAISCCFLVPAHMYLRDLAVGLAPFGPFFPLAPDRMLLPFGLYLLLAGALLGLTGSAVSVRRFLRRRPEWHG